ncbi:hypothetical protein SG34_028085 [Thalassomonas viridans]|uniref:Glutamate--cysteine ligase n=1 Tax=Thalassomonas viridans TaxID=137584 RepID=A0AAF0C8U4_9GAMM|nr:hypothetical protein [Thalassomonas viridans]WDE05113.1 hypothetical protein SG34_028085 [Thalassomonas viridans]
MGRNIDQKEYSQLDYDIFQQALYRQLAELKEILLQPSFGDGQLSLGAELEMYLVDDDAQVSLTNQLLLKELDDAQFQHELNQYNLELNLSSVPRQGKPFSALRREILSKTGHLEQVARGHGINIVPVGILPTLRAEHLNTAYMTDVPRYHCLSRHLYQQRGENFRVNINGEEPVSVNFADICSEGANTSFQVHLMTPKDSFVRVFNAAQLTSPLVTAIAGNSGIFLGKRLWDETRIALFKQSIDIRLTDAFQWQQPSRVNFGHGWVRSSPWELFAEAVSLYPVVLPYIGEEVREGKVPELAELSMHMGTIWPWHRPVFSNHGNGHVRIEFRAIPAGPTSLDMLANAAFAIGLACGLGLNGEIDDLIAFIPFRFAEYNFYRAAQHGLDARILWPLDNKYHPEEVAIVEVIRHMLPLAEKGLSALGIEADEISFFINIIRQRLQEKVTGAVWQKNSLRVLERDFDKDQACRKLVQLYIEHSRSCRPVATWERIWQ